MGTCVVTVPVNHPHKMQSSTMTKGDSTPATTGPNPAMKSKASPAPMNNEREPGAATAHSRANNKKAGSENIEGNESAMYEKLEKRSLTSLKGGGTEKELREGHNEKWIAGAIKKPGALHKQLGVPQGEKIPAKKMAAARSGKMGKTAKKRAVLAKTLSGFKKK